MNNEIQDQTITKEAYEMMEIFEAVYRVSKSDRAPKEIWAKKEIYNNGETNKLYLAYRNGVFYGKSISRTSEAGYLLEIIELKNTLSKIQKANEKIMALIMPILEEE